MELKSNLEEGTKVIKQLCTCLFFLCTQVSFWVNKVKVWNNFVPGFTPKSTKWKFWTTLSPALNELKKWKFRTALILTNLTFMDMQTTLNSILLNTALFYLIFWTCQQSRLWELLCTRAWMSHWIFKILREEQNKNREREGEREKKKREMSRKVNENRAYSVIISSFVTIFHFYFILWCHIESFMHVW